VVVCPIGFQKVSLKALTGVMRRRAPVESNVAKVTKPAPPVTFGGFVLDSDGNAEAEEVADERQEADEDSELEEDDEDEGSDEQEREDEDDAAAGGDGGDGPMVLFAEASLARGGLAGAWAKRQREATLMSPRPQARRVLQRFARLVQRSSLADAAAASGARATAEALADEACALAPAVLARGATLPGARVKSCSKQSGKLVLTLDATAGSSRSSSVSSGNVAKSGSARNTPSPGRKVKSLAVGQCVKGTVTKGGEAVHLGPSLEATLLAEAHVPAEGSVVDVVVCSARAQKGAAGQTVRVALAGTEVAAAAVKQAAAAAAAAAAAEGHPEGISSSSSSAAAAAVAAQEEFAALLAASEVSASGNYDMGDEDDEDDEDKEDVEEEEEGVDDEDEDDLPMNISDL
jgi:hypothetical protein